jgi:hypothetical protein
VRQKEQGDRKSRVTERAGRQQEQEESKSRVAARAGRQQEQGDSRRRATARAGSPATAETRVADPHSFHPDPDPAF